MFAHIFIPADIFRNQQLLKEYKDFWGNTKVRTDCMFVHIDVSFAVVERHHLYHLCVHMCPILRETISHKVHEG